MIWIHKCIGCFGYIHSNLLICHHLTGTKSQKQSELYILRQSLQTKDQNESVPPNTNKRDRNKASDSGTDGLYWIQTNINVNGNTSDVHMLVPAGLRGVTDLDLVGGCGWIESLVWFRESLKITTEGLKDPQVHPYLEGLDLGQTYVEVQHLLNHDSGWMEEIETSQSSKYW